MNHTEQIFKTIQEHGLRLTNSRKALIEAFIGAGRPLSYEDLKTKINMDKATFYRNMHAFETAHIIRKIESDDKKWYFELATTTHAHFICNDCHSVECLDELPVQGLSGYTVDTVIYKGKCQACNG
ncbi:MAG: transcriptional repressor [Sulfurimonadaceae bacterium]|nr:transcriptional repressor [Sulfurimonadaceae bacterium]